MRNFADSIKQVPVEQLKPYPGNPRQNKKAIDKVAASLREFGWKQPIVADKDMVIIVGHTRLEAAKKNGDREVPVLIADDLTPEQVRAYRLADNKTSEFAAWDDELLGRELDALVGIMDMELFGFAKPAPLDVLEDDFDVDQEVVPVVQPGEIWKLGRHKLMCGDCTKAADVSRLMAGRKANIIWTDPPWNVDYGGQDNHPSWKQRTILNDKMSTSDFYQFLTAAFTNMRAWLEPGAATYVAMSAQEWGSMMQVMSGLDFHWSSTVIWAKDSLVLSRKDYHTQYEPLWYGWLEGAPHLALTDRKQSDLWEIPRPKRSDEHPTMKPLELVGRSLQNSSVAGALVIDFFGGSGTTLIAAEQLERTCFMLELDPHYSDVIINRWEAMTGGKAVKER
jgi:DNA modification methylase